MDEKLREAEILYRTLFEQSPDGILIIDPKTATAIEFNEVAHRQLGYTKEEFKKLQIFDYEAKEKLEETKARIEQLLREGKADFETLHRTRSGGIRNVRVIAHTIELAGQTFFHTIFRDITELKRAEEAISQLAAIVESSDDAIIGESLDGTIANWNLGAERIYGYMAEEVKGRNISLLVPPDRPDEVPQILERIRRKERIDHFETVHVRKDGRQIYVSLTISPIKDAAGKVIGASAIARNITERKLVEEKLKQIMADLERSNKELEQFAYVASHDLQEPLRMVAGFTQLLEKRYKGKLDKDADEFIGFVVDGATRMQEMINDLLAYSRVGTRGKPFEPINCEAVFSQAVINLKVAIEEHKAMVTHDPLPVVMADSTQMAQLFQNLIDNAIKFHREEKPRVHVSARQEGSEWIFSVKDNGIGIAPEFFDRIFMMFQRFHREYPGTGMGLAICKKIAERHGGRIWVESEPGKGSTFYFMIPARGKQP